MTFNVDHTHLEQGIYINSSKVVGDKEIITYDIRICRPYFHKGMSHVEMHTVEHIMATYLEEEVAHFPGYERIYFGPMGCQTGFYLLMASPVEEMEPEKKVLHMIREACRKAMQDKKVPFRSQKACGNYTTLSFTKGVYDILWIMMHCTSGIKQYHYIDEEKNQNNKASEPKKPKVDQQYHVMFGDTEVVVSSRLVSVEEIEALAEGSCPKKFMMDLENLVRERFNK